MAAPIKRVWIDKDGGKKRPIGLSEFEDKIVQKAVSMLMGAVFEQDFLPISYGFREGCNAHDALAYLREQCMKHGIRWIYDADITGFFDNLDWSWLRTFIQRRINDGGILRLIGKWLNAGIMEGEQISYSDKGTPQGGVISPLLANLYFRRLLLAWRRFGYQGELDASIVNYGDDFVICCRPGRGKEARAAFSDLVVRIGLTLNDEKTRLVDAEVDRFDFLGYTIGRRYGKDGRPYIGTRPSRKAVSRLLRRIRHWRHSSSNRPRRSLTVWPKVSWDRRT